MQLPTKQYGRFQVYPDRIVLRRRFRRWQIERVIPLPLKATIRSQTKTQRKATLTRVAAGAAIAGPAGGVVGAMAKKEKTVASGFPRFEVRTLDGELVYSRAAIRSLHASLVSRRLNHLSRQAAL